MDVKDYAEANRQNGHSQGCFCGKCYETARKIVAYRKAQKEKEKADG